MHDSDFDDTGMDYDELKKSHIPNDRALTCDQIAWLLDIFDRYLPQDSHPRVSKQREMMMYGMLYEVMDIAKLKFEDEKALHNAQPHSARPYQLEEGV